ncbi:hypothetical protein KDD30_21610 (plasmid) [Photobacterium sp. GJ3]|uniref:hypothetical protein n=1 Tax=Photobacterium sp. GJ3 TaxID=2829502 RepID=UPI001B8D51A4|nr:hypothetical protein [Photobacterium sp. GJ3]QUJ69365.1 hypothetical protein KDD30_21610 [Photobacterium sp. GJ3]
MMKFLCLISYLFIFLPVWAVSALLGTGRFNRRFHQRHSTWDKPITLKRQATEAVSFKRAVSGQTNQ